jgi:hypothetical protein
MPPPREVEARRARHDDLAVEREPLLRHGAQRGDELREVAGQRAIVAAAQVDLVAAAEGQAAKAVPLGLVRERAARQLARQPGEHGRDRRDDREVHPTVVALGRPRPAAAPRLRGAAAGTALLLGQVGSVCSVSRKPT